MIWSQGVRGTVKRRKCRIAEDAKECTQRLRRVFTQNVRCARRVIAIIHHSSFIIVHCSLLIEHRHTQSCRSIN